VVGSQSVTPFVTLALILFFQKSKSGGSTRFFFAAIVLCARKLNRDDRVGQAEHGEAVFRGQGDSGGGVHLGENRQGVAGGRCQPPTRMMLLLRQLVVAAATAGEVAGTAECILILDLDSAGVVNAFAVATLAWLLPMDSRHERILPQGLLNLPSESELSLEEERIFKPRRSRPEPSPGPRRDCERREVLLLP
jgi:hypothetical protein